MQQFSFQLMKKTIWRCTIFVDNVVVCLVVSVFLSVGVGIIAYYFVEKPFVEFYKKRIARVKAIRNCK